MPAITVQSLELTLDQKRTLAKTIIDAFSELTLVPKERIYVFFDGYALDSAGTGSVLFVDRRPTGIRGKFNEAEWSGQTGRD